MHYDIALIVLTKPLIFDDTIQSINIGKVKPCPGSSVWIAGFGSNVQVWTNVAII